MNIRRFLASKKIFTFKTTCQYCFETFSTSRIVYKCTGSGTKESPSGTIHKLDATRLSMKGTGKCTESDKDGKACEGVAVKTCPYCEGLIIDEILDADGRLEIAIVGVASAGKTVYMNVMLDALQNANLNIITEGVRQQDKDDFIKKIGEIKNRGIISSTVRNELVPRVWLIQDARNIRDRSVPYYTFTFHDGVGGDIETFQNKYLQYLKASSAVLLLVDSSKIESVQRVIDPGADVEHLKNAIAVTNVAKAIRDAHGFSVKKPIDIPVAVVLSKFDTILKTPALTKHFPTNAIVLQPDTYSRQYSIGKFAKIDEEIREWLIQIGEESFLDRIKINFSQAQFFAVSSLGSDLDEDGKFPPHFPHRVLDPMLWLLHQEKLISFSE